MSLRVSRHLPVAIVSRFLSLFRLFHSASLVSPSCMHHAVSPTRLSISLSDSYFSHDSCTHSRNSQLSHAEDTVVDSLDLQGFWNAASPRPPVAQGHTHPQEPGTSGPGAAGADPAGSGPLRAGSACQSCGFQSILFSGAALPHPTTHSSSDPELLSHTPSKIHMIERHLNRPSINRRIKPGHVHTGCVLRLCPLRRT